jgi:hypothetical protein
VDTNKNLELTRLIGTRLREACGRDIDDELPAAIAVGLAALRDIEMHPATTADRSTADAIARHGSPRGE